jgi:hypothetical protein
MAMRQPRAINPEHGSSDWQILGRVDETIGNPGLDRVEAADVSTALKTSILFNRNRSHLQSAPYTHSIRKI